MNLGRSLLSGINDDAAVRQLLSLPLRRRFAPCLRTGAMLLMRWAQRNGKQYPALSLPSAIPGIMTGVILALSRAIGETAPLIMIGALTYVAFLPENLLDSFTVMPIQIFNWVSRPSEAFHELAASGIILLLIMLFIMNITVWIRNKYSKNI